MNEVRHVGLAKPSANETVVAMLEEWTAAARNGEVQAVALAGVKTGGTISTQWSGQAGGWLHQLISAVSILQYRIVAKNVEP